MAKWWQALRNWAKQLETEIYALYYAYRDERTPFFARLFCGFVFTMAVSPFDLIPDFIPILGYLDDAVFLPLGIWLAIKMIPAQVMSESREKARLIPPEQMASKRNALLMIIFLWAVIIGIITWLVALIFSR